MAYGTTIDRERERVREIRDDLSGWRRWGPYVSDRSWGTVREDYSHDGNAWAYLTYDKARAKAYRWGEDGIAGVCDRYQLLCFAPAFWNERDPHLKERLFGVNPYEGNHGEDVKEYYFHVDNTPSHSYMCLLYKYPQASIAAERHIRDFCRRHKIIVADAPVAFNEVSASCHEERGEGEEPFITRARLHDLLVMGRFTRPNGLPPDLLRRVAPRAAPEETGSSGVAASRVW